MQTRKRGITRGTYFLLLLLLTFGALAVNEVKVTIEPDLSTPGHLNTDGSLRYFEREDVELNVYVHAVDQPVLIRQIQLRPFFDLAGITSFSFVTGADSRDYFFVKNFIANEPQAIKYDSTTGHFYGWNMLDIKEDGATVNIPTVDTPKQLVGKMKAKAWQAGDITLSMSFNPADKVSFSNLAMITGRFPTYATIIYTPVTIHIVAESCGDTICSFSESIISCNLDCGCQINPAVVCTDTQLCYLDSSTYNCEDDLDNDDIPDRFESNTCINTPSGLPVYPVGSPNAGCQLGDINANGCIDFPDWNLFLGLIITAFENIEYRGPGDLTGVNGLDLGDWNIFLGVMGQYFTTC